MKAVGFYQNYPIDHPQALEDIELPVPELRDHDLLVEVMAVSVNPVDTKIRRTGDIPASGPRVVGWELHDIDDRASTRTTAPRCPARRPG